MLVDVFLWGHRKLVDCVKCRNMEELKEKRSACAKVDVNILRDFRASWVKWIENVFKFLVQAFIVESSISVVSDFGTSCTIYWRLKFLTKASSFMLHYWFFSCQQKFMNFLFIYEDTA